MHEFSKPSGKRKITTEVKLKVTGKGRTKRREPCTEPAQGLEEGGWKICRQEAKADDSNVSFVVGTKYLPTYLGK